MGTTNSNIKPTVTIVMPFYNHKEDVMSMVESIAKGKWTQWQLLAIDDGSTDGTAECLHNTYAHDPRVEVIRRSRMPKGAQTCRNMGLDMAKGKYIVFFDSDDLVAEDCLQVRVTEMENNEDVDFMVFPSGVMANGNTISDAHPYCYGFDIYKDDIAAFAMRQLPFIVWNNIYRTESLRRCRLRWCEQLLSLQDADFNISAMAAGLKYRYAHVPQDYFYRIDSSGSVSKKIEHKKHADSHLMACERMIRTVRETWGDRYDRYLYQGTLTIYNARMSGKGIDSLFAQRMADMMARYCPWYATLLNCQRRMSQWLGYVIPKKTARQIPMAFFLAAQQWRIRQKTNAIAKILSANHDANKVDLPRHAQAKETY